MSDVLSLSLNLQITKFYIEYFLPFLGSLAKFSLEFMEGGAHAHYAPGSFRYVPSASRDKFYFR